jgi:hypothetical protein
MITEQAKKAWEELTPDRVRAEVLSRGERLMTGVYSVWQSHEGKIKLNYEDGTEEIREDGQEWDITTDNIFAVISFVQEARETTT